MLKHKKAVGIVILLSVLLLSGCTVPTQSVVNTPVTTTTTTVAAATSVTEMRETTTAATTTVTTMAATETRETTTATAETAVATTTTKTPTSQVPTTTIPKPSTTEIPATTTQAPTTTTSAPMSTATGSQPDHGFTTFIPVNPYPTTSMPKVYPSEGQQQLSIPWNGETVTLRFTGYVSSSWEYAGTTSVGTRVVCTVRQTSGRIINIGENLSGESVSIEAAETVVRKELANLGLDLSKATVTAHVDESFECTQVRVSVPNGEEGDSGLACRVQLVDGQVRLNYVGIVLTGTNINSDGFVPNWV